MLDLKIDHLNLDINDASGQEHRVRPIVTRALSLLTDRIETRWLMDGRTPNISAVDRLTSPRINLYLQQMSDEQAARDIADAMLQALAVKLGLQR